MDNITYLLCIRMQRCSFVFVVMNTKGIVEKNYTFLTGIHPVNES